MKTVAVVAWREFIEHRVFLIAALAALAVTLIMPLLPTFRGWTAADVREVLAWGMALGFSSLGAVLLGASTISGTTAAGRFGFFVSRPLSGAAIWLGKLAGVLVLLIMGEAIILAPVALDGSRGVMIDHITGLTHLQTLLNVLEGAGLLIALGAPLPLVLVLVGHAVGTVWRGRTPWILLDLLTLLGGATVGWLSLRPLVQNGADEAKAAVVIALGAALLVPLAGAPLAQVASGGVSPRRHHRLFSLAFGVPTLILFGGVGGYAAWLTVPNVADLITQEGCHVNASPDGRWIFVSGEPAGRLDYAAAFLLDLDSSTALRIDVKRESWGRNVDFSFSADGSRVAWLAGGGELWWIRYADLDAAIPRRRETGIFVAGNAQFALSEDGGHVAVIDEATLSVSTFPAGGLLGAIVVAGGEYGYTSLDSFDRDGTVRLSESTYSRDLASYTRSVIQFNPSTREVQRSARSEGDAHGVMGHDWTRYRLLIREPRGQEELWRYVDAETLEDVGWTRNRPLGSEVEMLADGRLVDLVSEGRNRRLELLTPDGALEATVPLPPLVAVGLNRERDLWLDFDSQPVPDRLLIRVARPSAENTSAVPCDIFDVRLIVLNLADGTSQELKNGLDRLYWIDPPVGSPASRLLWDRERGLVLWDPETGETEELAARYE